MIWAGDEMERRYQRERKYRLRVKEKKRVPIEKTLLFQSGVCAFLLAVGIVVSYADIGGFNRSFSENILYKSNTYSDWKKTFTPVIKKAEEGTKLAVAAINRGTEYFEKKAGMNEKPETAPVKARAKEENKDKEDIKEVPEETPKEPEPIVFRKPTEGEVTSDFGSREKPISGATTYHQGIDLAANSGQTVISAAKGVVKSTGYDEANGHFAVIDHGQGFATIYAHLLKTCVVDGETVDANTKIGEVGSSGISTGPHLHFEIKLNDESVNPEDYIDFSH